MNTTVKIALSLIPTSLRSQPLLLCIDDTMVAKYGTKVEQFEHLDIVCNVRKDTVLYELPPKPSGKRGRPKKYGEKLSLEAISLSEQRIGGYYTGVQMYYPICLENEESLLM